MERKRLIERERVSGILQIKAENYSKNCVLCVILWQSKKGFRHIWSLQIVHYMRCVLVPFKKEELLEVHGMGFKKYEQYKEQSFS